ncbi:MAG: hypothetical protein DWQ34_19160 [Planctomycetota bacterium]|nr:MAG: hypothetical protein DWQ34_19160 [Planctomycetota bacterium]REK24352.1 MAG: hypothetical protein DWQ41_15130 [Planctomycetota bacterium]REK38543.1 MAG: hypothetical protein DWQ45_03925 [Planctomycetota bacterium]
MNRLTLATLVLTGLLLVGVVRPLAAQQYPPPGPHPLDHRVPEGVAGRWAVIAKPGLHCYLQPVQFRLPGAGNVTFYDGMSPDGVTLPAPAQARLGVGGVYRAKLSEIEGYPGLELYPSVEVLDRLHPPPSLVDEYPIPVEITAEEIEAVLSDRMVTKVIYLERENLPRRGTRSFFSFPVEDVSTGQFTGGAADLNEEFPSDADFAFGADNTADTLEVRLAKFRDPGIGDHHTVRYRAAKTASGMVDGEGSPVSLSVSLWQGTTLIARDTTRELTGEWTTYWFTLEPSVAEQITDYGDLRLKFETSKSGGEPGDQRGGAISWAGFEIPEPTDLVNNTEVEPQSNLLDTAAQMGRPVAILRLGGRTPAPGDLVNLLAPTGPVQVPLLSDSDP